MNRVSIRMIRGIARSIRFPSLLAAGCLLGAVAFADGSADENQPRQSGVGIALRVEDGKTFVSLVLPDTPAARSNAIQPDDQILTVAEAEGEPVDVKGLSLAEVVGLIRGSERTVVRLTIVPSGKELSEARVVSLVRGPFAELNLFGDGKPITTGADAPSFRFTRLDDGRCGALSQFAGRYVVLEFWASWCGPCRGSLDRLQELRREHPEWKDQVELLAMSVDEERANAEERFDQKRWRDIIPVWVGPDLLRKYHVNALPAMYVIDPHGKIVASDLDQDLSKLLPSLLDRDDD